MLLSASVCALFSFNGARAGPRSRRVHLPLTHASTYPAVAVVANDWQVLPLLHAAHEGGGAAELHGVGTLLPSTA